MQYFVQIYAIVSSAPIDKFKIALSAITMAAIMEIKSSLKHCFSYKEINTLCDINISYDSCKWKCPIHHSIIASHIKTCLSIWKLLFFYGTSYLSSFSRQREENNKTKFNTITCVYFSPSSFCGLITWFKYTSLLVVRLTRAHKVDKQLILIGKLSGKNKKEEAHAKENRINFIAEAINA